MWFGGSVDRTDAGDADPGNDRLEGRFGGDEMYGGAGNDTLIGFRGDDTLVGGAGNDQLDGGLDSDSMLGGEGNDVLLAGDGNNTVRGGAGSDYITAGSDSDKLGDPQDDPISPFSAAVVLDANGDEVLAPGDTVYAGGGPDMIFGSVAGDSLFGELGDDSILGGDGNDVIDGDDGSDVLDGQGGNDTLSGGFDTDTLLGSDGSDIFANNDGRSDVVDGGAGLDHAQEESTDDNGISLDAFTGIEVFFDLEDNTLPVALLAARIEVPEEVAAASAATPGPTPRILDPDADGVVSVIGTDGVDTVVVTTVSNFPGNRRFQVRIGGLSRIFSTTAAVALQIDTFDGGDSIDLLSGLPDIYSVIYAGAGNDTIRGGAGDENIDGGTGADWISGGNRPGRTPDLDTLDYSARTAGIKLVQAVDAASSTSGNGEAGENDVIFGDIEFVTGGMKDDILIGSKRVETFAGGVGADSLDGGRGGDTLLGNKKKDKGADTLLGGPGADFINPRDSRADSYDFGPVGATEKGNLDADDIDLAKL
jgi:Ca2+-binding RTX toxin-like protein